MEVYLYPSFNLGGRWVSGKRHSPASLLRERDPAHISQGGWVVSRTVMDGYEKCDRHRTVRLVASRYTD
jgi:hypothetical protein